MSPAQLSTELNKLLLQTPLAQLKGGGKNGNSVCSSMSQLMGSMMAERLAATPVGPSPFAVTHTHPWLPTYSRLDLSH